MAAKKKMTATTGPETIRIPVINVQEVMVPIVGTTSLIMHKFAAKAIKMMEDKQRKVAKGGKTAKDPYQDFLDCIYYDSAGDFAMPSTAFKASMISSIRQIDGMTMTQASGAFHIFGDFVRIYGTPTCERDTARNETGVCDLRYRPYFEEWTALIPVSFNADILSKDQVVNLLNHAGFSCGIGDWRPSSKKNYSGNHGLWRVCDTSEHKTLAKKYKAIEVPSREDVEMKLFIPVGAED